MCRLDDPVRWSVIARRNIKADTVLCIYSGMAERALRLPSAYAYGYITDRVRYQIDANSIGGIARFLPHLPTSADIIRKNIERMALRDDPRMNSLRGMSENAFQEAIQALFVRFYGDTQFELESISFSDNVRKEVIATENVKFYTVNSSEFEV